jgi:hypothetical protein
MHKKMKMPTPTNIGMKLGRLITVPEMGAGLAGTLPA